MILGKGYRISFTDKMVLPTITMVFQEEYCQLLHYKTENIDFLIQSHTVSCIKLNFLLLSSVYPKEILMFYRLQLSSIVLFFVIHAQPSISKTLSALSYRKAQIVANLNRIEFS